MNKQEIFEIGLGIVIGFMVYLAISFTLWELDFAKWHWIARAMWLLMSIGAYLSIEIQWEYIEEDES